MRLLRDKLGIFALVLGMVFCSSFSSSATAVTEVFKIQNVTIETTDGEIIDFDEEDITSSANFKITGDTAKYTITIKNTDDVAHIIENITDNNENPYITYEYDTHVGEEVASNADLILVVTAKYTTYITDVDAREQFNSVKFQIQFTDAPEEVVVTPEDPSAGEDPSTAEDSGAGENSDVGENPDAGESSSASENLNNDPNSSNTTTPSADDEETPSVDSDTSSEELEVPDTNDNSDTDEVATPNTGDSTSEKATAFSSGSDILSIIIAVFAIWFVIVVLPRRRNKNIEIILPVAIALLGASVFFVAPTANAAEVQTGEFILNINFTLEPGRIIHYDGNWPDDGEMEDERLVTGGTLSPNAYTAVGYHFTGWALTWDGDMVYGDEEPMDNIPGGEDPLNLYVYWEPNTYTIYFHVNSEFATGTMEPMEVEFDSYRRLPANQFVSEDYRFTGWKVDNEGDLILGDAHADMFETEHEGEIHLYAQWEVAPIGIVYSSNGSDVVGIMPRQERFGRTAILNTPNFRRDGYGFIGWNTEPDGTGTMYGTNETVPSPTLENMKLYATWMKAEEDVTMQTFDSTTEPYASYPIGKVIALRDNRDGQTYTVAKLADDQWWMTENLRLVPSSVEFTAENTNNPTTSFLSATIKSSFCDESTVACINSISYSDAHLYSSGYSATSSYRMGVYYNAFAATAGHAEVDPNNLVTGQAAGDICPKGWHLPVSGSDGDFVNLDIALGGTGRNTVNFEHAQLYFQAPINLIAAGWAEGYTFRNSNSDAVYFESGTNGLKQSISTFVDVASEIVGGTTEKYFGHTVRCIAE